MMIEKLRSRLLIRLSAWLGVLWLALMAFGFLPVIMEGWNGFFSVRHLPVWWSAVAWAAVTPFLLILFFVLIENSANWRRFAVRAFALFVVLFAGQAAGAFLLRILVDGYVGPPTVVLFRLMIFLLFTIEAWSVILFVSIISKMGLERMEASLETTGLRRRTIEAGLREQYIRTQPARLVSWLRSIARLIPHDQDGATSELVELGDYLRDLLRHSKQSTVPVAAELETWNRVRRNQMLEVEAPKESLHLDVPAGLLVALFERIGQVSPGARVVVGGDEALVVLTIDCGSGAEVELVGARLSVFGLESVRISDLSLRLSLTRPAPDDPADQTAASTILTSMGHRLGWAVATVFAMAVFAGIASTTQIVIGQAMDWTELPFEFSMPPWIELAEWLSWGLIGVACMMSYLRSESRSEWLGATALLGWLIVPHLIWGLVIHRMTELGPMASVEYQFEQWDFALRAGLIVTGAALFRYLREVDGTIEDRRQLDEALGAYRMTRLRMIRAQLQPHFLLNALHAVNAMIAEDPERAARLAESIGLLLEETAERVEKGYLRLAEEIAMARRYLEVLSMRYEDRLMFEIEWDERLSDVEVPALATQPLLENALVHGVESSLHGSHIGLRVQSIGGNIVITVTNPARPGIFGPARAGLGLANTEQTLKLCYGDDYLFEAGIVGKSFVARMQIPSRRAAA